MGQDHNANVAFYGSAENNPDCDGKHMRDTLAIIGNFTETRNLFSFDRTDCDIWVFNESMATAWYQRADAVFQMHKPVIWRNPRNRNDANHWLWLVNQAGECRSCGGAKTAKENGKEMACPACAGTGTYTPIAGRENITIYMQETYPEVLNSVRYPVDEIVEKFKSNYFSSSVSYALALGIHQGYQRIELFGIGLATDTEYRYQRDGFTFWCGIAKGCGVDLIFHGDIFNAPMYGYDGDITIGYEVFTKRLAELEPQTKIALEKYKNAKGAMAQALNKLSVSASVTAFQEITELAKAQVQAASEFGGLDGAMQENRRYKNKADIMREASGSHIFSRQEFEASGNAIFKERAEIGARFNALGPQCEALLKDAVRTKNKLKRENRIAYFSQAYNEYVRLSNVIGVMSGGLNEDATFLRILDANIKAAGGSKSEEVMMEAFQNA